MLWINGHASDGRDLVLDEGFLFGRGVFETIRVHGQPLFWNEHMSRLNSGLEALNICPPVDALFLLDQVRSLPIQHCILKVVVSPGNLILQTRPLPDEAPAGWRLAVADGHRTTNPLLLASKNLNYLDNLLIWEKARQDGFDDAILLDAAGHVCETSRANLFFIKEGHLHTPDLSCGLLDGVIRQWIMTHFQVHAGVYPLGDLITTESIFVTNSVIGVQPVRQIGTQLYADSPLVMKICAYYRNWIASR